MRAGEERCQNKLACIVTFSSPVSGVYLCSGNGALKIMGGGGGGEQTPAGEREEKRGAASEEVKEKGVAVECKYLRDGNGE